MLTRRFSARPIKTPQIAPVLFVVLKNMLKINKPVSGELNIPAIIEVNWSKLFPEKDKM